MTWKLQSLRWINGTNLKWMNMEWGTQVFVVSYNHFAAFILIFTNLIYIPGLSVYGVQIDTPPDEPGSAIYRAFASHRIIVENVIARIKDFRAAKDAIRGPVHDLPHVLAQHQKIWTILAVIVSC